jgi:hypothetical protein
MELMTDNSLTLDHMKDVIGDPTLMNGNSQSFFTVFGQNATVTNSLMLESSRLDSLA